MSSPASPSQFDKLASVAIQGGGVYGLNLLGQLQGVIDQGYRIVALSGTSAGAIVATLYWAGVPIEIIRSQFERLAGPPNHITDLLGNDQPGRRPMSRAVVQRLLRMLRRTKAGWAAGWLGRAIAVLTGGAELTWLRASGWADGGLFPGGKFENLIDQLIRDSPRVAPHVKSGRLPREGLLTFGHLWSLLDAGLEPFPALILTATNLTTGGLELIDSTDPRHAGVPIASAVRASGGFPGFFIPVGIDLPDDSGQLRPCRLVDGGVICNFPGFVFSRWARVRQLGTRERYREDVLRPWVNIGLRLTDPPNIRRVETLPEVIGQVVRVLTGGGRTILETRLTEETVERYVPCELPFDQTRWPFGLLDFDRLTADSVRAMFEAGRHFAAARLNPLAFDLPPVDEVVEWMEGLVDVVAGAFADPKNERWALRATLFVPHKDELVLHYGVNMNGRDDTDAGLTLNDGEGLVGYCFDRRTPLLCNLTEFADRVRTERDGFLPFRLSSEKATLVRRDRTWLLSVPVFDPQTASPERFAIDPDPSDGGGVFAELESPLDGAVFGVLCLDARFDYTALDLDPNPVEQVTDPRLRIAYDTLTATAWDLGKVFANWFARS